MNVITYLFSCWYHGVGYNAAAFDSSALVHSGLLLKC